MAPPAKRVPGLMDNLHSWLKHTDAHPLVASCVYHYELEFIHPFSDGNGRLGRLWQTLILSRWNPLFAFLPVETVIRDRQADYYRVLGSCDKAGNSTDFIEFLLEALRSALRDVATPLPGEQVGEQLSEQVARILKSCAKTPRTKAELLRNAKLSNVYLNYKRHILPLLQAGLIERTIPDKPNSRLQKYRLTDKGRGLLS
jgi:Fic family protein